VLRDDVVEGSSIHGIQTGPRTELCGASLITTAGSDLDCPMHTVCRRCVR
jgi:hypothetical protein